MNDIITAYIIIIDVSINLKKCWNEFSTFSFIQLYMNIPIMYVFISVTFSILLAIHRGSVCTLYGEHVIILISFFRTKYSFFQDLWDKCCSIYDYNTADKEKQMKNTNQLKMT